MEENIKINKPGKDSEKGKKVVDKKKIVKIILIILSPIVIIALLLGAFLYGSERCPYIDCPDSRCAEGTSVEESLIELAEKEKELEFKYGEKVDEEIILDDLTFEQKDITYEDLDLYIPDGAIKGVEYGEDDGVCTPELCYDVEILYEDLEVHVIGVTGIGGTMHSVGSNYYTVYRSPVVSLSWPYVSRSSGILATVVEDSGYTTLRYWRYNDSLQIGVEAINVSAKFKSEDFETYADVVDKIALSVFDLEPQSREWGVAYYDSATSAVYRIDDGNTTLIVNSYSSTNEAFDNMYVSPSRKYLAIISIVDSGPKRYVQVYDLDTDSLVTFEGNESYAILNSLTWVSNSVFVAKGEYVNDVAIPFYFDLEDGTVTEITTSEYDSLGR